MIKNKIYYLLLGIGLGMIISSSMNIVFNKAEKIEYTDEQIKERAKSLGMISIKENIENNDKEKTEEKTKEVKPAQETKVEPQPIPQVKEGYGTVVINREDTASSIISRLKKNDIIENEEEFRALVVKHSLQGKFRVGTYEIEKGLTYVEVLKKIIDPAELKKAGFL